jgi:hypothetical protein
LAILKKNSYGGDMVDGAEVEFLDFWLYLKIHKITLEFSVILWIFKPGTVLERFFEVLIVFTFKVSIIFMMAEKLKMADFEFSPVFTSGFSVAKKRCKLTRL